MVLKTGLDWPVQPRIGALSGLVLWKNRKLGKSGQKSETVDLTVKTANQSGWTGFGLVPLIPKLHRFCSFFPNLKPIFSFLAFPPHSLVLTPLLPFSLCLSVSHSYSHVLTSGFSWSHLQLLTVSPPASWSRSLTLVVSHLTVSLPAWSHLRDSWSRSFTISP